jgi:ABC-2 type transport system permease protein
MDNNTKKNTFWNGVWGTHRRNVRLLVRQRQLLVAPLVVPLVMMILTTVITAWGGDDWRVGLVNLSSDRRGAEYAESIRRSRSEITPYFKVVESDLKRGREAVRAGTLQMLIIVPEDFRQSREVLIETFNINSDAMKNVRLRIENSTVENLKKEGRLSILPKLVKDYPGETWRAAYIGGSCILLSLFLGALMISANLYVYDYENRTRKEVALSPLHPSTLAFGILVTSILMSIILSLPALLLAAGLFRFQVHLPSLLLVYLMMVPILIACAALGTLLGRLCKSYRIVQPVVILSSVATFCGAGGFVAVNMLPPAARVFADIWVFSFIFEWFNPVIHGFQEGFAFSQYAVVTAVGLAGLAAIRFFSGVKDRLKGGM